MTESRQRWTADQERMLLSSISAGDKTLSACFLEFAQQTGRSKKAVENHYYKHMKPQAIREEGDEDNNDSVVRCRKWTPEEDAILARHIDASVTNLKACFMAVSEIIGRTPGAVASHWYGVLSKKAIHFATISKSHVAKNRKNGVGVPSNLSIWKRFCNVISRLAL